MKPMIYRGELIGKSICITASRHPALANALVKVLDETKYTLLVERHGVRKRIHKAGLALRLAGRQEQHAVTAAQLMRRPEERL